MAAAPEQILFLHLRWESNQVHLVDSKLRPGHLKPSPHAPASAPRIQIRLADLQGLPLWTTEVPDPRSTRIEFPGPAGSGTLQSMPSRREHPETLLRVPLHPAAAEVQILELPAAPAAAAALPAQQGTLPQPGKLLGRFTLATPRPASAPETPR
ncbi:MAG TPA: hypothetical protein DCM86_16075 [Verrucomicrobiales bacterium]|nr:hypothetical protein [Verrucomicrobiales bacterium]